MERVKRYLIMLYVIMAAILMWLPSIAQTSAPVDMLTWPDAGQLAAREMRGKYGKPDVESEELIIWLDKRQWKKITISKTEVAHSFPIEHTDMLEQTVSYQVPPELYDEIAFFDGSITIDRTQGTISSRCDSEANNMLALNLAHDIITGKKTVTEARQAYSDILRDRMAGKDHEYMQKLLFVPDKDTSDSDINTTGLTREDIMNAQRVTRN